MMLSLRLPILLALFVSLLPALHAEGFYDRLIARAEQDAPGEVQLHLINSRGKLSNFIAKVRDAEKIPGWQRIRVSGDAAFAFWDSYHKDYVWKGGEFEVIYEITDRQKLKLSEVTFNGTTRKRD